MLSNCEANNQSRVTSQSYRFLKLGITLLALVLETRRLLYSRCSSPLSRMDPTCQHPFVVSHSEPGIRNGQCGRGLAAVQILFGIVLLGLEITGLVFGIWEFDIMSLSGAGIWNGVLYIATGICGVAATRNPQQNLNRRCPFVAFLVLSIISSIFAVGMLVYGVMSFILGYAFEFGPGCDASYYQQSCTSLELVFLIVRGTSMAIYLTLFVMFIYTSAIGCCNICSYRNVVIHSSYQRMSAHYPTEHIHPLNNGYPYSTVLPQPLYAYANIGGSNTAGVPIPSPPSEAQTSPRDPPPNYSPPQLIEL